MIHFRFLFILFFLSPSTARSELFGICGTGTIYSNDTAECVCDPNIPQDDEDANLISLAGIIDTTTYTWATDIFKVTVDLLNQGEWGVLPPGTRVEYQLGNAKCDETTAVRSYWNLRTLNGGKAMHGIVGARCSGASMSLARISGLEGVPHLSPASNSARLSDDEEFPFFSRLVAPNDENGEVGALLAMLHAMNWERVTILATDTTFSKDLVNEFRRLWVQERAGEVAYSDTIRINANGTVNEDSIRQELDSVPTDDPTTNSRIIFLAAHSQHAFPILRFAHENGFQPDSVWVGPSSWIGRDDFADFSWLPAIPGYLGVSVFRNRDSTYQRFMKHLQAYQRVNGNPILSELPTFAAETVDSIRALTWALVNTPSRRNGQAVVRKLRQVDFDGVSGRVQLADNGDRQNPQFSIFNAQSDATNGNIAWTDVGTTETELGSTEITEGLCFAQTGCGGKIPIDRYPVPRTRLPFWVILLVLALGLLFVLAALKYWRSHLSKRKIKDELAAFRDSVVGMRAAECMYIPRVKRTDRDIEQALDGTITMPVPLEKAVWMWQETTHMMDNHDSMNIYGDPEDCWILYDAESTRSLEEGFQRSAEIVSIGSYSVNIRKMEQTKVSTGFKRKVQRVLETVPSDSAKDIDLTDVQVGEDLPSDLNGEPRIVLVEGDIVQISQQRRDGWAFGTKLHHADEATVRQLVRVSVGDMDSDDVNVFPDSGWFQLDKTRVPTGDDLRALQQNVGDTGALAAPPYWDPVSEPSVAQRHELRLGDPERTAVENAFLSTLRPPSFNKGVKVVKIERIQNLSMWQSYVVKRQTLCCREIGQTAAGDDNELHQKALERFERKWLFHGSNQEVMEKVLQQGLNRSFCGKNATVYGKGVYFARDASYSAYPTYAVPDNKGNQYMMACRVIVGEYCLGKHNALTPDVRHAKSQTLYDTTVDNVTNPSIYVTYHDAQAYPEYLITFQCK